MGGRELERNIGMRHMACIHTGAGEPATEVCALDQESNSWPFGMQVDAVTTELTGQGSFFFYFS